MATTETRPGFRLPWTSDHREPRGGDDDAGTSEPQAGAAAVDETPDPSATTAASSTETPEESVTPSIAPSSTSAPATGPSHAPAPEASAPQAAAPARVRPTKFLADLTKAMQAAAQAEREETLRQYGADAKAFVEQYRAEAAERATGYRKESDEDVLAIRDWSKAEMARIREETERRIAERKAELESELEAHADRVDRAIRRIESRVDSYEAEMAAFFERLLAVDDPTAFAAMAANMPEPPPFSADPLPSDAEATHGSPDAVVADSGAGIADAGTPVEAADAGGWDAETGTTTAPEAPVADTTADADDAWAGATWSSDASSGNAVEDGAPSAAATADLATSESRGEPESGTVETPSETAAGPSTLPAGLTEQPVDPRLAALGLTPDFAAAEAEAAVDLAGDGSDDAEGVIPVDDEALALRIAGLVAADVPGTMPSGETQTTAVTVVGLVSVASIAGFKRNLARTPGVQSVSVSSGPDGEFIFTTVHHDIDLASAIAALPGFDARVIGSDAGVLHVAAHDPESAS